MERLNATADTPISPTADSPFFAPLRAKTTKEHLDLKRQERIRHQNIWYSALAIGTDICRATNGLLLDEEAYSLLHTSGYVDASVEDVVEVFEDWADYQAFVKEDYEKLVTTEAQEREQILAQMQREIDEQSIPEEFTKEVIILSSDEHLMDVAVSGKKRRKDVAIAGYGEVDETTQLKRYSRMLIARALVPRQRDENGNFIETLEDYQKKLVGIVLGYRLDGKHPTSFKNTKVNAGKLTSSFTGELTKSNSSLANDPLIIEEAILAMHLYDLAYPEYRDKYLKEIRDVAQLPPPSVEIKNREYYDLSVGELVGKTAVEGYFRDQAIPKHVVPLAELMCDEEFDQNFNDSKAYRFKDWDEKKFIQYAYWLRSIIRTVDENAEITHRLLNRGSRLNIGPDGTTLVRRFGSLINFYRVAGLTEINAKHQFDNWTDEDFIDHIRKVAAETEGPLTATKLSLRIEGGAKEPSPTLLRHKFGALGTLYEAAGLKSTNKKISLDDLIDIGYEYYRTTGQLPTRRICDESPLLPSRYPLYKHKLTDERWQKLILDRCGGGSGQNST